MKVISIGDLVLDYYYKDGEFLGVCGGMTSHNIVANLSKMKIDTQVFGCCGNDSLGEVAIKSLTDLGVDTSRVIKLDNVETRSFHVSYTTRNDKLTLSSKKRCPVCNNKHWYKESLIDTSGILNNIAQEDILVFDNLNSKNLEIINNTTNKKVIDIGQYFEFEDISLQDIRDILYNKFTIINLNERVSNYLIKRFKLQESELFDLTNAELITITKGSKGATFIHNGKSFDFYIDKPSEEIDSTGAGDAFISSIISSWIDNNLVIQDNLLKTWFDNSFQLTSKVVTKIGARGHLQDLYKVVEVNNECLCTNFKLSLRRHIKRCSINVNNLEKRLINACKKDILCNIEFKSNEVYLFVGTGGSYAGAVACSKIVNQVYSSTTLSMYPRDVLYRCNKSIDKVFLFSYSGTTNDILECIKLFDRKKVYLITKGDINKILESSDILKENILSYKSNTTNERGFLSFEGAVAPALVFLHHSVDIKIDEFITNSIKNWHEFFKEMFKQENIKDIFKINNTINIFYGDNSSSAGRDLESKIIESGVYNAILHEKKNFSHGRFINYENVGNKYSIYFKGKDTFAYEKTLLNYLTCNTLVLESKYDGLLCEVDLLIASQILVYYISKLIDVDLSKPEYSDSSMKLYFYKGDIK